jgi:hypothetical protein
VSAWLAWDDVVVGMNVDPAAAVEVAEHLRAIVEAVPPANPAERATARRIEGAAVAPKAMSSMSRVVERD